MMRGTLRLQTVVSTAQRMAAIAFICGCTAVALAGGNWKQWGGPNGNWTCDSKGLATEWPEAGPTKLWTRPLGEGYSAVVADDDLLFTMFRGGEDEVIIALAADTGKTVWEYKYPSPKDEKTEPRFGLGPNSTPLVIGNHVCAIGRYGKMSCLDKKTGKLEWSAELWKEKQGTYLGFGYSSSPIAYKNSIIALVGGKGQAVMSFNPDTGSVMWSAQDFANSYSTPVIINVDGEDQIVAMMAKEAIGLDPNTGDLKWSFPSVNEWDQNICLPVFGKDNLLYISAEGDAGSHVLKLTRDGAKTNVEEVWSTRKMRMHHNNAIRIGDYIYGVAGSTPSFFMAVNVKDGKIAYRERGFAKATCLHADGKFIVLDEDGVLSLATATPEGLKVLTKATVLEKVAWTVPTLLNDRLIVRDTKNITALALN